MSHYSLVYVVGTHHVAISCSKEDFYKVVDDLSEEFEIVKQNSKDISNAEFYYYRNYYDDLDMIGAVYHLG